ncbi:MAG: phospho-N-acetylmuramoyl-pentapeptide-transferase [Phycisphaerales bacterium]|jgi:phospho-N-acetylmuramoyl-pentapeptide-transferase|nr:phospho-N-acetylmuramoyl-pentapeptide-transferase [Phycisphaerales bacterium]MBT7171878.1 phospho-N-acetylmuramoyl-pentapeptide-transferase [Phycisphaerales bacterium]
MIYYLFESYFQSGGLILRIALSGAMSFLLVMILGPKVIRFLVKKKIGDRPEFDHGDLNKITRSKENTPTMGGVLVVGSILVCVLLFGNLKNMYINSAVLTLVWLGVLGVMDDWIKLRETKTRDGLKAWEKLVFQMGLPVLLSVYVYRHGVALAPGGDIPAHNLYLPFYGKLALPFVAYSVIMVLVMTFSSNAVNITDGMDGLAAGNLLITTVAFLALSWIVGVRGWAELIHIPFVPNTAEMTVLCSAMIGALLGFLWYNTHPAAVFMGDAGSLPLGGLLGYIAVITRQEFFLLVAGGVFAIEAFSSLLQKYYYKYTRIRGDGITGKRIFRIAPLHHHFQVGGIPEEKIVVRFWLVGLLFAVAALGMLRLQYPYLGL